MIPTEPSVGLTSCLEAQGLGQWNHVLVLERGSQTPQAGGDDAPACDNDQYRPRKH